MKRVALVSLLALFAASCQNDGGPLAPVDEEPFFEIQDGFTDENRPGAFWLAPIRPYYRYQPPRNNPFDGDLNLTIEICEWANGCVGPVWDFETGASFRDWIKGRGIRVFQYLEEYSLLWKTRGLRLKPYKNYRIRALVGEKELAFADVDVVRRLKQLRRVDRDEYAPLIRNGILPIRIRIEEGALCDPALGTCVSETIDVTEGGTIPFVVENETVAVVTVEPTTGEEGNETTITLSSCLTPGGDLSSLVDLPLFGDCVEITADPPLTLAIPATASLCAAPDAATSGGLTHDEIERLTVHRASLDESELFNVVALPHGDGNCPEPIGMSRFDQVLAFAQDVIDGARDRMVAMVTPAAAWAFCDRGGCGSPTDFESAFQVARPAQMNYGADSPSDGYFGVQTVGTVLTAQVVVTDLGGDLVEGATLHAAITSGGGSVSPGAITTGSDGIAEFDFTVGSGLNVLEISGACVGVHSDVGGSGPFSPDPEDGPTATPVACGTGTLEFSAQAVRLVDAASILNLDTLRLTTNATFQRGAAWTHDKKTVDQGFTASFSFRISDLGVTGADGFNFVIQNQDSIAIGNAGGGIGYEGITSSLGIEFDTWLNVEPQANDPDGNHISVHTNGLINEAGNPNLVSNPAGVDMSDGALHDVTIVYTPGTLTVSLDNTLVLTVPVDLTNIGGSSILDGSGQAWLGLTSATGVAIEKHDIFDVRIEIP